MFLRSHLRDSAKWGLGSSIYLRSANDLLKTQQLNIEDQNRARGNYGRKTENESNMFRQIEKNRTRALHIHSRVK